jgi:hypothetical protein
MHILYEAVGESAFAVDPNRICIAQNGSDCHQQLGPRLTFPHFPRYTQSYKHTSQILLTSYLFLTVRFYILYLFTVQTTLHKKSGEL